jgi:predicted RND superfamily exporter protein
MADGFVSGVNEALGFAGFVDSQALPLFGMGVETIIGVAASAINQAITLHND